jgi:hypothetical protein
MQYRWGDFPAINRDEALKIVNTLKSFLNPQDPGTNFKWASSFNARTCHGVATDVAGQVVNTYNQMLAESMERIQDLEKALADLKERLSQPNREGVATTDSTPTPTPTPASPASPEPAPVSINEPPVTLHLLLNGVVDYSGNLPSYLEGMEHPIDHYPVVVYMGGWSGAALRNRGVEENIEKEVIDALKGILVYYTADTPVFNAVDNDAAMNNVNAVISLLELLLDDQQVSILYPNDFHMTVKDWVLVKDDTFPGSIKWERQNKSLYLTKGEWTVKVYFENGIRARRWED